MASIVKSENLTPIVALKPEEMWIIVYGKDKFYITNFEREAILDGVRKGLQVINVGGKIFTNKFLYILPSSQQKDAEYLAEGKWRCEYGNWHNPDQECNCDVSFVFDEHTQTYYQVREKKDVKNTTK